MKKHCTLLTAEKVMTFIPNLLSDFSRNPTSFVVQTKVLDGLLENIYVDVFIPAISISENAPL